MNENERDICLKALESSDSDYFLPRNFVENLAPLLIEKEIFVPSGRFVDTVRCPCNCGEYSIVDHIHGPNGIIHQATCNHDGTLVDYAIPEAEVEMLIFDKARCDELGITSARLKKPGGRPKSKRGQTFTQEAIAKLCEVSVSTVANWERGTYSAPVEGYSAEMRRSGGKKLLEWIDEVRSNNNSPSLSDLIMRGELVNLQGCPEHIRERIQEIVSQHRQ